MCFNKILNKPFINGVVSNFAFKQGIQKCKNKRQSVELKQFILLLDEFYMRYFDYKEI